MKKLVLLVDDEEIIRMTSGEILVELGFEVLTAGTGEEAILLFKSKCSEIAIAILDMTLPDMSGIELYNEIKKIPSSARFLMTSGYRQDMTGMGNEIVFIQKPYTITELNNKLNDLIG